MSTNPVAVIEKRTPVRSTAWLSGFLLLGLLLGLLGSLLIGWQYHIDVEPRLIGLHFLALNAGYVIAATVAQRYVRRVSLRKVALISCAAACLSLVALALAAPPAAVWWRIADLGMVGASAGGLATGLLYVSEPYFAASRAAAVNLAGALFGCGCLVATLVTGATYFAGSVQMETGLLAAFPLVYFAIYLRNRYSPALSPTHAPKEDAMREMLKDLRSIATILFSLLLFIQFGNEWVLAGWLPLLLIHRLGVNPVWAIGGLAWYFLALMVGRLIAQVLLPLLNHRRLLLGSILLAMAGYLLLSLAATMTAAMLAVALIGAGYAPIFPLIAEKLDDRFSFHPGFYNGTVSIAVMGAMSAPWLLGYVDAYLGMQYVMLLPALGSLAVLVLALLIMFEAHLMGGRERYTRSR